MTSKDEFLEMLREQFYPELRDAGFKGSGQTLRRRRGEVIHVINIQGSAGSQWCYLNLGVHLTFLPSLTGVPMDMKTIKEYECALRTRVQAPLTYGPGWPYGTSPVESETVIAEMHSAYQQQAESFWSRWSDFPRSFLSVTPADTGNFDARNFGHLPGQPPPLVFARIALHLGNHELAKEFARVGLEKVGTADLARAAFEKILSAG